MHNQNHFYCKTSSTVRRNLSHQRAYLVSEYMVFTLMIKLSHFVIALFSRPYKGDVAFRLSCFDLNLDITNSLVSRSDLWNSCSTIFETSPKILGLKFNIVAISHCAWERGFHDPESLDYYRKQIQNRRGSINIVQFCLRGVASRLK